MHELSLAQNLVELAVQAAAETGACRVRRVTLRIGSLSCVHADALRFCYDLATQGTILEGSRLVIEQVAAAVYCEPCGQVVELPTIQSFRCPRCGTPSSDVRRGNELDLEAIELEQPDPMDAATEDAATEDAATEDAATEDAAANDRASSFAPEPDG